MNKQTEYIKLVMTKTRESSMFKSKGFLSSGSTLLNLGCTGSIEGAWPIGACSLIIGDSRAGKTWLAMSAFAEACIDKRFNDHRFVYDDPEGGAQMDIEKFFGKQAAERIEAASYDRDNVPQASDTTEEFYYRLDDLLRAGEKFIYAVDSIDCLSSYAEGKKVKEMKTAFKKGKPVKGIMTDGKAKVNSANLRNVVRLLEKSESVLLILCQTRENLNSMFDPKTRSGGKSLRFYSAVEVWLSIKEHYKRTVRDKPRRIGVCSRMKVEKSRITGRTLSVDVPIMYASGMDDVGGCIDYLLEESEWKKCRQTIDTNDFVTKKLPRGKLIAMIEKAGIERELSIRVGEVWEEIDRLSQTQRKKRYE